MHCSTNGARRRHQSSIITVGTSILASLVFSFFISCIFVLNSSTCFLRPWALLFGNLVIAKLLLFLLNLLVRLFKRLGLFMSTVHMYRFTNSVSLYEISTKSLFWSPIKLMKSHAIISTTNKCLQLFCFSLVQMTYHGLL